MNETVDRGNEAFDASLLGASREVGSARRHCGVDCACASCRAAALPHVEPELDEWEAIDELGEFEELEGEDELRRGRVARPFAIPFARPRPGIPPRGRPIRPQPLRRPLVAGGFAAATGAPAYACPPQRSEYVRWVQSALNRTMNLGLPVTGLMNAATRSALRQFQTQQQLAADGIAGPETKDALLRAAAPAPAAMPSMPSSPPASSAALGSAEPAHELMLDELLSESFGFETPTGELYAEIDDETPREKSCREAWEKWLAARPAPVQEMAKRVKSLDDMDALMLRGIQYGMRAPADLAKLAFYSLHQFGYCPPQKADGVRHLRDSAHQAKRLLNDAPVPPGTDTGPVACKGRRANKPDTPQPDAPVMDFTGRYYFFDQKRPYATVLIDQAGRHISMRATRVLMASDRMASNQAFPDRPYKDYEGDLQPDGSIRFFDRDKPTEQGAIVRSGARLEMKMQRTAAGLANTTARLYKLELRPTLLAPALDLTALVQDAKLAVLLERHELYPLVPAQIKQIRKLLDKAWLDKAIRAFFNADTDDVKYRVFYELIQRIDELRKQFHASDLPLVRMYAREELTFNKYTSERRVRRSHLDWIQMMTDTVRTKLKVGTYDYAGHYSMLASYLGIRQVGTPTTETPNFNYEVTIQLYGAALLVGAYAGTIRIEQVTAPKWSNEYPIDFAGVVASIGPDVKLGGPFKGVAQSYLPWTANDVRGTVRMFRAAVDAGMGLASAQAGFMHILGDGTLGPLDVFFQDASLNAPDIAKVAEESLKDGKVPTPKGLVRPDAQIGALFGTIGGPFWTLQKPTLIDASSRHKPAQVAIEMSADQTVHFCLNSALLSDIARQSIRQMCADHLPLFTNPRTRVAVVGHTDSVGSAGYNLTLSNNRAQNTLQAIRDVLGKSLKVSDKLMTVIPAGELVSRLKGRNEKPDPKFRKVDVFLNGHLVLTLR